MRPTCWRPVHSDHLRDLHHCRYRLRHLRLPGSPCLHGPFHTGHFQLRAFAGVVIGGFGSIKGAVIGCLLVGIVESFSTMAFSGYKDVTVFLLLIIVLVFRPTGLFKGKIGDKA